MRTDVRAVKNSFKYLLNGQGKISSGCCKHSNSKGGLFNGRCQPFKRQTKNFEWMMPGVQTENRKFLVCKQAHGGLQPLRSFFCFALAQFFPSLFPGACSQAKYFERMMVAVQTDLEQIHTSAVRWK